MTGERDLYFKKSLKLTNEKNKIRNEQVKKTEIPALVDVKDGRKKSKPTAAERAGTEQRRVSALPPTSRGGG